MFDPPSSRHVRAFVELYDVNGDREKNAGFDIDPTLIPRIDDIIRVPNSRFPYKVMTVEWDYSFGEIIVHAKKIPSSRDFILACVKEALTE